MKILIDDMRNDKLMTSSGFIESCDAIIRNAKDGIQFLIYCQAFQIPVDVLYLDHDLGLRAPFKNPIPEKSTEREVFFEESGYGIAAFLEMYPIYQPKEIFFVSSNTAGVERMRKALERFYPAVMGQGRILRKE